MSGTVGEMLCNPSFLLFLQHLQNTCSLAAKRCWASALNEAARWCVFRERPRSTIAASTAVWTRLTCSRRKHSLLLLQEEDGGPALALRKPEHRGGCRPKSIPLQRVSLRVEAIDNQPGEDLICSVALHINNTDLVEDLDQLCCAHSGRLALTGSSEFSDHVVVQSLDW